MKPQKKLFVISPIGKKDSDIREHADLLYDHIITTVAKEFSYIPERADKIAKLGYITTAIVKSLYDSDLVIADLSFHNPNVFYELAIRHVAKKHVILIKKGTDKIPFDIAAMNVVSYDDLSQTKNVSLLLSNLRMIIKNIDKSTVPENPISIAIDLDALSKSESPIEKVNAHIGMEISNIKNEIENNRTKLEEIIEHTIHKKNHYGIDAEYIDGEDEAFKALTEATLRAKKEVRSTRFFPHSVLTQQSYVNSIKKRVLGADGKRRLDRYYRIVALNNKSKHHDIISHLNNFATYNFKLYLTNYENNFELVIIDDTDAFIHFYKEEKIIASTLHLKDKSVVREFRDIFDKLRANKSIVKVYDCKRINSDNLHEKLSEVHELFVGLEKKSKV